MPATDRHDLRSDPDSRIRDIARKKQSGDKRRGVYEKASERSRPLQCTQCGAPIWVLAASEVGLMCFTCITGEADPSSDYEIDEACDKLNAPLTRKAP